MRTISNGDVFDLVKLKKSGGLSEETLQTQVPTPQKCYVFNPYGGFRVSFVNDYIVDYMMLPKGGSSCLIERATRKEIVKLS